MKKNKLIVSMVVAIVVVGGAAFFAGTKYAGSNKPGAGQYGANMGPGGRYQGGANGGANVDPRAQAQGDPRLQGPRGRMIGGFSSGQIVSNDDKSFTMKTQDGSSIIVFYSDQTAVAKADKANMSDLAVGQTVTVSGKGSPDGSVMAQDVQIKPAQ